ncbi:L-threonine kinase [Filibacter limicola]|uniref:L-threonine kinase n=1 Tax=Sporosarcina limicola TaxID=34101 RepID=A0A927MLB1_9BACL|nr:L-threonine kinase [Sporosarcina limicola]
MGKGLSSSTADLIAAARAVADFYNMNLSSDVIEDILKSIEPSDGIMYPGVTSYYHKKIEKIDYLGCLPGLAIVSLDEGGIVDTIEYNQKEKEFLQSEKEIYKVLLSELTYNIKIKNYRKIGEIATRSSLMNQNHNYKKNLYKLLDICKKVECLGVVTTHSGTCIGIMINQFCDDYQEKIKLTKEKVSELNGIIDVYYSWDLQSDEYFRKINYI